MRNNVNAVIKSAGVFTLNVILILGLIITFFIYDDGYKQKLYGQNMDEISNINQASANISSTFFTSRESKLRDLALYIDTHNLSLDESMDYIYSTNSDKTKSFEIIGSDYKGYRIDKNSDGSYIPLDYSKGYGNICSMFLSNSTQTDSQAIRFAPEFTDGYTAMKSFALYNCIQLTDENGEKSPYTVMVVSTSADFINMININSGYEKLATTIINKSGNYIIGNSEFRSDNFYKYLSVFNDWTLDEKIEAQKQVENTQKGFISCNDGRNRDSVFVYTPVPNKEWYCVTAVPTEFFRNSETEYFFALIVVAVMVFLFIMDLLYLSALNRKLKISAENERVASAAKTDFLARMSHDMRTPMNGIIGMTRLTQDIMGLPDEVQRNLSDISDSSAYLLQLINDTLDMSKIESSKFTLNPQSVNVKELIRNTITAVKPLAEQKNVELELVPINLQLDYIRADRMRVQQIFMNILSNAIKFTPPNGKIRMIVECIKLENDIAYDRVIIEDSGCGMSSEFLEHIFEPFSQEKTKITTSQEGTGLGMAIVKNLVELMGGRIEIASTVGVGTKVTIYINFNRDYPSTEAPASHSEHDGVLEGKRILLAEDHPMNATIATRLLGKKGIITERAENGAIALRMFSESEICYYDMILMDIRMPEMDGLEATRQIRSLSRSDAKTVPIIAMTANAYAEDIQAAFDAGMNAHLAKPIEPEVLYSEIEEHL